MTNAPSTQVAVSTLKAFVAEVPHCDEAVAAVRYAGLSLDASNHHALRIFSKRVCMCINDILDIMDPSDVFVEPLKDAHLAFDLRAIGLN